MKILPTPFEGVFQIELETHQDDRGSLARTWCEKEFTDLGLNTRWPQGNLTRTLRRGIIRGMHWQALPRPEIKLIRCSTGRIWDVVVDVRPTSATFGRWEAFELDAQRGANSMSVPVLLMVFNASKIIVRCPI